MISFLVKKKRFLISSLFLIILFTWSVLNTVLNDGEIPVTRVKTDDKGDIISSPPYPPLTEFIFGSDQFGWDMGMMMVEGAKWTIGITILVSLIRILISIIISSFTYSLNHRLYSGLKTLCEPFSIVPQTIIVYFILYSILWMPKTGFATSFWERALFQTVVMVMVAIPNLTIHLSNDMRLVQKESFIEASTILGSSKPYVFFKHIIPHVYERWILLFGQQFIQTLQLLAHLGFMKLFFGGTKVPYGGPDEDEPPRSISYEWSGVVGGNISYLYHNQWMILVPVVFFIITAISVALINQSIQSYFHHKNTVRK